VLKADLAGDTRAGPGNLIDAAEAAALATELRPSFSGKLLAPGDAARTIWNAMIDRRPGLIARCASTEDVAAAVRLARKHDLLLSVRGGGHGVSGKALCDGGLTIALSRMRRSASTPAGGWSRSGAAASSATSTRRPPVPDDGTAFPNRNHNWWLNFALHWDEESGDQDCVAQIRRAHDALKPWLTAASTPTGSTSTRPIACSTPTAVPNGTPGWEGRRPPMTRTTFLRLNANIQPRP
jgi:hypothetical protein